MTIDTATLFRYGHLSAPLQEVSKPFHDLAQTLNAQPASAEITLAIRKLWEAKNLAVYAVSAQLEPLRRSGE